MRASKKSTTTRPIVAAVKGSDVEDNQKMHAMTAQFCVANSTDSADFPDYCLC